MNEIVETCELAVTRLSEVGWVQQTYHQGETYAYDSYLGDCVVDWSQAKACLGGALVLAGEVTGYTVFGKAMDECPAVAAVAETIREKHPELGRDDSQVIFEFNDTIASGPEDVIEVLRETIKRHTSEVVEP